MYGLHVPLNQLDVCICTGNILFSGKRNVVSDFQIHIFKPHTHTSISVASALQSKLESADSTPIAVPILLKQIF